MRRKRIPYSSIESEVAIGEYLAFLTERGRDRKTISAYESDLRLTDKGLSQHGIRLLEAKADDITRYLLNELATAKPTTVERRFSSLKGFYLFHAEKGNIAQNPLASLSSPRAVRRSDPSRQLSQEELDALLHPPGPLSAMDERNRLLLDCLAGERIESSQLGGLTLDRLDLSTGVAMLPRRGNRTVLVTFNKERVGQIRNFVETGRHEILLEKESRFVFPSMRGNRLGRKAILEILQECTAKAGIRKEINTRELRDSFVAAKKK